MGVPGASISKNPTASRSLKKTILEQILDVGGILEGCGGGTRQLDTRIETIREYQLIFKGNSHPTIDK